MRLTDHYYAQSQGDRKKSHHHKRMSVLSLTEQHADIILLQFGQILTAATEA